MCLEINKVKTAAFKNKFKVNKKIKIYKILNYVLENGDIKLSTPQTGHVIRPGWFVAEGPNEYKRIKEISEGVIHCFVNVDDCICPNELFDEGHYKAWLNCAPCTIITGYAYTDDLVAVGQYGDYGFKKVFFSESELKKTKVCLKAILND